MVFFGGSSWLLKPTFRMITYFSLLYAKCCTCHRVEWNSAPWPMMKQRFREAKSLLETPLVTSGQLDGCPGNICVSAASPQLGSSRNWQPPYPPKLPPHNTPIPGGAVNKQMSCTLAADQPKGWCLDTRSCTPLVAGWWGGLGALEVPLAEVWHPGPHGSCYLPTVIEVLPKFKYQCVLARAHCTPTRRMPLCNGEWGSQREAWHRSAHAFPGWMLDSSWPVRTLPSGSVSRNESGSPTGFTERVAASIKNRTGLMPPNWKK